jgi:acetyl-CoA decarbonylase/synthase complex subunit alpha
VISIGGVEEEEEEWEPMGPTPKPSIKDLRSWDMKLLQRYQPSYLPFSDMCDYCTFGKCDLTGDKEGACGIDLKTHSARQILDKVLKGLSAHESHARHLLEHLIERHGEDAPLELGQSVNVEAPVIRTIIGKKPETFGDLREVLDYIEEQSMQLLGTTHTGQEGSHLDFESKALHAGMLDILAMEVADIIQISAYGMPKADPDAPLADVGMGSIDPEKPVILAIGHNVAAIADVIDYLDEHDLWDEIEIGGLCCTAHDMTRKNPRTKMIGSLAKELRYIRSGIPDVIVVDSQCVRADVFKEASRLRIPVIACNEQIMYGLKDRTDDNVEDIIKDLVSGREKGVVLLDFAKVGEVAVKVAQTVHPLRREQGITAIPTDEEMRSLAEKCVLCRNCQQACPVSLPVGDAIRKVLEGSYKELEEVNALCVGCGRCEQECRRGIPTLNMIIKGAQKTLLAQRGRMRIGRGQVSDPEIREEGVNLVMGTTPGVIAIVGCPNYAEGTDDVYEIAEELLKRNYIVAVSGCIAVDLATHVDEEGKSLYEKYPGRFSKGNLFNLGSCVTDAHIGGVLCKVPNIFGGRNIRGNFEEIADYTLNRTGACGLALGAYSQKALAIATGVNRFGVPVVVGPHAAKYGRAFIGKPYREEDWKVWDARDGEVKPIEPAPEHLLITAETKEEILPLLAKLCIRPSDNNMGRMIKLTNYIELSEKYLGRMPDDWHRFVRSEADLPVARRGELLKILEEQHGWKIDWDKHRIVEGPKIVSDVSWQPTNVKRLIREEK